MITHRNVFFKFRFYNIAPTSGIELNGLFGPNSRPFPFFLVDFFFPIPACVFGHDPVKGGGCHTPILGAPLPSFGGLGVPIWGAPLPVKAFNTIGIPILASKVPSQPPDASLLVL